MEAVIMTGGKGTRLAPYTSVLPKGLLPIGEKPMLHTIVLQLKHYGIQRITMSCGYLGTLIETYFGDGSRFGIPIRYVYEDSPLGTIGALKNIEHLNAPFLVLNCDILTTLSLRDLIEFHRQGTSLLTIASQEKNIPIQLGVLVVSDDKVVGFAEKPQQPVRVSMGMYVMDPLVLRYIPEGKCFDVPDLIVSMLKDNQPIRHYENHAYWLDVGTIDDYNRANHDFQDIQHVLIPGPGPGPGREL